MNETPPATGTPATGTPALDGAAAPSGHSPLALLVVALYASLLYLPFLGSGRMLTAHEGMVTQPALRMLETGEWIVPRYTRDYWLDKPPLMSWVTAGVFAMTGGFSEFGARLPAALSAIGLSVLVTVLAGRFFDRTSALLAGLVQASCVYALLQGRLGEIDVPLTLLIAGAHAALAWNLPGARSRCEPHGLGGMGEEAHAKAQGAQRWLPLGAALVFHTLAGLAVLAKGPVAVAFFAMTIFSFCIVRRSIKPLIDVVWTPAVLAFLAITVAWHVGAYMVAGHEALDQWYDNYVKRFEGEHHLGREPFWFYLLQIPWLMLPWTIALVIGGRLLVREARRPGAWFERFLWCWFLGGVLFLSISAFKHKHYCFPALPPLAILTARVLVAHIARVPKHAPRFYVGVFAVIAVVFVIVNVFVMPKRDPRRETIEFVQREIGELPADAKVLVVGLGQHAAYPYIPRPCLYAREARGLDVSNTLADVRTALADARNRPLWVLTLRQYVQPAADAGIAFTEIAAEAPRKRVKPEETLVLLSPRASAQSAPTSGSTSEP